MERCVELVAVGKVLLKKMSFKIIIVQHDNKFDLFFFFGYLERWATDYCI